jgi:hypothetical protein
MTPPDVSQEPGKVPDLYSRLPQLPYVTLRDETLPHQVVFLIMNCTTMVSCNCLAIKNINKDLTSHDPIGPAPTTADARELYDNPNNHRGPKFTDLDRAKW